MDKNTLSNYGWIVVLILVLSVLLALATPFGRFVADGFEATYEGFDNTSNKAFSVLGLSENDGGTGENGGSTCSHPAENYIYQPGCQENYLFDYCYRTDHRIVGCSLCGATFTGRDVILEEHTYEYSNITETTHTKNCIYCLNNDVKQTEIHDDTNGDGKCDGCGKECECAHKIIKIVSNYDGTHNVVCRNCGNIVRTENCIDGDDDSTCDACGVSVSNKYDNPTIKATANMTYFIADYNEVQTLNVVIETSDFDDDNGTYFAYKGTVDVSTGGWVTLSSIGTAIGNVRLNGDYIFYFYTDTSEHSTKIFCTVSGPRITAVNDEPSAVLVTDLDYFSYLN